MDVKSKIKFINSVAGGQKIPCPKCNTLNEADAKFCITCGSPIDHSQNAAKEEAPALAEEVICQGCGKPNKAGSKFCIGCGKPLSQNPAPSVSLAQPVPPAPPESLAQPVPPAPSVSSASPVPPAPQVVSQEESANPKPENQPFAPIKKIAPAQSVSEPENQPFAPIKKIAPAPPVPEPVKSPVVSAPKVEEVVEEPSVFAEGLPAWDIVPPQVMVRRKRK